MGISAARLLFQYQTKVLIIIITYFAEKY